MKTLRKWIKFIWMLERCQRAMDAALALSDQRFDQAMSASHFTVLAMQASYRRSARHWNRLYVLKQRLN